MDQGPRGDESERWLWKQWSGLMRLRQIGVPMLGFTWYSLIDQVDWDTALREVRGKVNPRGLYDLDRNIRPVGRAYQRLISEWGEVLRREDACLRLPLVAA
jgi:beta-glucosidase/6-phospho-beta-glucosidase/beta-galactosidase